MRLFAITLMITALLPTLGMAECNGRDLRATLSETEAAELDAFRAKTPFGTGNRWVARRGAQEIQIVGTMHLNDPRWPEIVARIRPALKGAELLMIEMTDDEQARMKRAMSQDPSRAFITQGPTLPDRMSDVDWQRLSDAMAKRGMPSFMVAKTQPWFLSLMLGIPACVLSQGEAGQNGLDKRLIEIAQETGIPSVGLERHEDLFAIFTEQSIDAQLRLLLASLPMAEQSDDQFATVVARYFDQDNAGAWAMADIIAQRGGGIPDAELDAMMNDLRERLLDRRNAMWMDKILPRTERHIFIAVGALHLMGEAGLLHALQEAGYQIERLPF